MSGVNAVELSLRRYNTFNKVTLGSHLRRKVKLCPSLGNDIYRAVFNLAKEGENCTEILLGNCTLLGTAAKQKPNQPTMNLVDVNRRTVLHETGHALGFGHEHQNPNVSIQWNRQQVYRSQLQNLVT